MAEEDYLRLSPEFEYSSICYDGCYHKIKYSSIEGKVNHDFITNYCKIKGINPPHHFRISRLGAFRQVVRDSYKSYISPCGDSLEVMVNGYLDNKHTSNYDCFVGEKYEVCRIDEIMNWFENRNMPVPAIYLVDKSKYQTFTAPNGAKIQLYDLDKSYVEFQRAPYMRERIEPHNRLVFNVAQLDEAWTWQRRWHKSTATSLKVWFLDNDMEPPIELKDVPAKKTVEMATIETITDPDTGSIIYHSVGKTFTHGDDSLEISGFCLESYPCQHDCILNGKNTRLGARSIYKWFVDRNMPAPSHFNYIEEERGKARCIAI